MVFFRDASQARTLKCWNERIAHPDESHDSDRAILVSRVERIFLRSKMIKDWITYELLGALHRDQLEMTRYLEKFIELAKVSKLVRLKLEGNTNYNSVS